MGLLFLGCAAFVGCGSIFAGKTGKSDKEMVEFAETKQRAATFYDGGDYYRAAAQFKKALEMRPDDVMTQLGYAYSLKNTEFPPNLILAIDQFNKVKKQKDLTKEVKRVYGLADAFRTLAIYFRRRAEANSNKGLLDQAEEDRKTSIQHANDAILQYERVLAIDHEMETRQAAGQFRASASLAPMSHLNIGVCCIVLGDRKNQAPLERAVEEVEIYAQVAANARTFWEKQREKLMETDPMADAQLPSLGEAMGGVESRRRYDERIRSTVTKEILARQALIETYLYLERLDDAIEQCTKIIELDDSEPTAFFFRARSYTMLDPPQYERAIEDMKEGQKRQDSSRLTQDVVKVNQILRTYERKLEEQKKQAKADAEAIKDGS